MSQFVTPTHPTTRRTNRPAKAIEGLEPRRLFSLAVGADGVDLDALAANPHDPTQIVVRFRAGAADVVRASDVLPGTDVGRPLGLDRDLRAVRLGGGVGVAAALARYRNNPLVEYAEPNWTYTTQQYTDNGKYYDINLLWGMYGDLTTPTNQYGSQAGEAWAGGATGSSKIFVGVIDEGLDYTHPDLYRNIAINQGEIPASVKTTVKDVDNDQVISFYDLNDLANRGLVADANGNRYIDGGDLLAPLDRGGWADGVDGDPVSGEVSRADDLVGWNFANNTKAAFDGPVDDHGTHVAGTIGASAGPDDGVAGVNHRVGLIPAKFLVPGGGSLADAIQAVDYFTDLKVNHGVNVVATNNSWGGGAYSQALHDAIIRAAKADILFVAAAGNGNNAGVGQNNDSRPYYPDNYNTAVATTTASAAAYDSVISVAAIDKAGAKAKFSNYGKTTVDLAAPGVSIFSTVPLGYDTFDYTPDGYAANNGTSMAAPHVTGAAALYAAKYLGETGQTPTARSIKDALLQSATRTTSVATTGKTPVATGGRLNIPQALTVKPAPSQPTALIAPASAPATTSTATSTTQFANAPIRPAARTGVWALVEDRKV